MLCGSVGMVNVYATEAEIPIVQVSNLKYSYEQMQQDLDALEERGRCKWILWEQLRMAETLQR